MEFCRQEYWSGLPFPTRDLPNPGIEPMSLASPTLAGRQFTTVLPGPHANLSFRKLSLSTYYVYSVSFLKEFKYTQIQKND